MSEPTSWRGWDGEDDMTDEDWMQRAGEQARAMLHACDPFLSSPDEDGCPTGGEYNGDYPDSWHDYLNMMYDNDESYREMVDADLETLEQGLQRAREDD